MKRYLALIIICAFLSLGAAKGIIIRGGAGAVAGGGGASYHYASGKSSSSFTTAGGDGNQGAALGVATITLPAMTVTKIGLKVDPHGSSSETANVCLYSCTGGCAVGKNTGTCVASGVVTMDGTTGAKWLDSATISAAISAGDYALILIPQGSTQEPYQDTDADTGIGDGGPYTTCASYTGAGISNGWSAQFGVRVYGQ